MRHSPIASQLRVLGFELARQPVAFENRELNKSRRVAVADMIDRLNLVIRPFGFSALELGE